MWIVLIVSVFCIGLIKLSVIFLYRRLFTVSRWFNLYSNILIVLTLAWTIAFVIGNIFHCGTHPAAAWTNARLHVKYCDDSDASQAALATTDLALDLMIIVAPMPIIWRMRLTLAEKLQVSGVFALGFM